MGTSGEPRWWERAACRALLLVLPLAGCSRAAVASDERPLATASFSSAGAVAAEISPPPPRGSVAPPAEPPWAWREQQRRRLFRHLASHCHVDELGPSDYALQWLHHGLPRSAAPAGAPWPNPAVVLFPGAGTPAASARAKGLEARLAHSRESHVVDCSFVVPPRTCRLCRPTGPTSIAGLAHYAAYLPRALFDEPEKVRSLLVYAPGGGKGGRSRPFLTEVPGKTVFDSYAGGLATKQRIDEWAAAHPGLVPPVFVSLQSNGDEHENGPVEYLTRDVPTHVAEVFLGGREREELRVGVEGVSSGSRQIVLALREKPQAFEVVGLSCMSCGPIHPDKARLGKKDELEAWSRELGARARRGELRVRFAIGSRDNQLPCNRRLHALWSEAGVFGPPGPVELTRCEPGRPPDERSCDSLRGGFATYRGELHDYRLLRRSYGEQLTFLLDALPR